MVVLECEAVKVVRLLLQKKNLQTMTNRASMRSMSSKTTKKTKTRSSMMTKSLELKSSMTTSSKLKLRS